MYVHLIKTIADSIHLVFSLGDLTGYLVNPTEHICKLSASQQSIHVHIHQASKSDLHVHIQQTNKTWHIHIFQNFIFILEQTKVYIRKKNLIPEESMQQKRK